MVLIETEPEEVTTDQKTRVETTSVSKKAEAESDGFETASEGDVSDDEKAKQVELNEKLPEIEVDKDAEALKQKALEEANGLKVEGNKLFVEGQYDEALLRYECALEMAPDMVSSVELKSICHSNRATCFYKLGKYEDTIKECKKALELNPNYMKALIRKADAHEKLEHFEEAIADLNKIIELDPSNNQARITKRKLEPLAAEKREKMKEEMIGKLKEMGNSLLGRFGMSIDNFKTVQDPNTGSYSVQFQR